MTIRLLGTGAAEGIPAFYSETAVSMHAREHGGRDVRTRSSALVDGHLKIDLGPDSLHQINRDKLDARDWTAVLFTHSHDDHFAVDELQYCLYPFNCEEYAGFAIFGNRTVEQAIWDRYPGWPFEVHRTQSFEAFTHAEYTITPIRANHLEDEDGHNFIIEKEGRALLYATDTGVWDADTFRFLEKFRLDALVIECTEGFVPTSYAGHLDIQECLKVVEKLRKQLTLVERAQVVTTHHSHNGGATYDDLVQALTPHGIQAGYDGLEFTI